MKKISIFKKIIIWLFENYAYDYWVDLQIKQADKDLLKKYNTDDLEKAKEYEMQEKQEQLREACNQFSADDLE